jgi:hypothetical protein
MALTPAERQQRARDRRRAARITIPGLEPDRPALGPAVDEWLATVEAVNPALAMSLRLQAAAMDGASTVNPAAAAELRRTVGQIAADARRMVPGQPEQPPDRPSPLDELRAARRRRHAGG